MTVLQVPLNTRTYFVKIGYSLFKKNSMIYPFKPGDKVMLVTNENIANIWSNKVVSHLENLGVQTNQVILPDGEQYKTLKSLDIIITELLRCHYNRNCKLIGLGGGVIGDLTGFAASVYQRGINYIQIPTTLLAQVDASIGGKTAVNHVLAKNMIGTFWQPSKVIIDIKFLSTLSKKELISGLSEVIKYAVAFDLDFFGWLEKYYKDVLRLDYWAVMYCIKKCCKIKSLIVSEDEKENSCRVLLNLGHTYAHAIESFSNYKWLHGEAVAVGIIIASYTSHVLGHMNINDVYRIINLIKNVGLPIESPKNMDVKSYVLLMKRDKKIFNEEYLRLVLPIKIGEATVFEKVNTKVVEQAIIKCM
ncbi:3-dehydroquinate synthase [Buchnera aphidicola (Nipponaphis monzeni)]|uniref:3-dehydroquinate synthase n=1 Tax=Buchnera aphidicola (Nipponaphis monzeni) TaxID=2495405 RepID=A0A455TAQ4_9GAMM|nr:3-dehydroquinate synthase [Buchnera aphidicola]BBI01413.1 3-dehydroquinate synthase [Buchnera aphidicola (Nipponaphis monzeni)]